MSLVADAMEAFRNAEKVRDAAKFEEATVRVEAETVLRLNALTAAKVWAIPILNLKFGERGDWNFTHASPPKSEDPDAVTVKLGDRQTLEVHKDGRVTGDFRIRASLRYDPNRSATSATIVIRDLEHLGQLMTKEHEITNYELSNPGD